MDYNVRNKKGNKTDKDNFQNASCPLTLICFRKHPSYSFFQYADQISYKTYRMI